MSTSEVTMQAKSEKKSFIKFALQFVPVASVIVAILAFVTNLELRKKELTCVYLGSDNLINVDSGSLTSVIKVDFQGKAINSLTKMRFLIKNSGSGAIKGEDVKEAVGLQFHEGAQILGAQLEDSNPKGFIFKVSQPEKDVPFVRCDFPLLNTGDEAYISVYVFNSPLRQPDLVGRIVDVKQILNINSDTRPSLPLPFIKSAGLRKLTIWILITINCLISVGGFGLFCGIVFEFIRFRYWESKWGPQFKKLVEPHQTGTNKNVAWYNFRFSQEDLQKAGIPAKPPNPDAHTWGELLSYSLIFLAIVAIFAFCATFIATAPWT